MNDEVNHKAVPGYLDKPVGSIIYIDGEPWIKWGEKVTNERKSQLRKIKDYVKTEDLPGQ